MTEKYFLIYMAEGILKYSCYSNHQDCLKDITHLSKSKYIKFLRDENGDRKIIKGTDLTFDFITKAILINKPS